MSFLLDPPALFVLGVVLYFVGNKLKMERLARITIGLRAVSGLWSHAFGEGMPVFIIFEWALNAWAVCGLAQVFGVNMRDVVVK